MNVSRCYGCGDPIPELRRKDGKLSFYCQRCTCATKWKSDFFEVLSDWNEGHTYTEDEEKFWKLVDTGRR